MNTVALGNFLVSTGKIVVTDPAYVPGTWCQANMKVAVGQWTAQIHEKNGIVNDIVAFLGTQAPAEKSWVMNNSSIGVDSGILGIYDHADYLAAWDGEENHSVATNKLHAELPPNNFGGVVEKGTVCKTIDISYYNLYVVKDVTGEIIALKIKFVY